MSFNNKYKALLKADFVFLSDGEVRERPVAGAAEVARRRRRGLPSARR